MKIKIVFALIILSFICTSAFSATRPSRWTYQEVASYAERLAVEASASAASDISTATTTDKLRYVNWQSYNGLGDSGNSSCTGIVLLASGIVVFQGNSSIESDEGAMNSTYAGGSGVGVKGEFIERGDAARDLFTASTTGGIFTWANSIMTCATTTPSLYTCGSFYAGEMFICSSESNLLDGCNVMSQDVDGAWASYSDASYTYAIDMSEFFILSASGDIIPLNAGAHHHISSDTPDCISTCSMGRNSVVITAFHDDDTQVLYRTIVNQDGVVSATAIVLSESFANDEPGRYSDVKYIGNGVFVAVNQWCDQNSIFSYSKDFGLTWVNGNVPADGTGQLSAYDGLSPFGDFAEYPGLKRFIAVGENGTIAIASDWFRVLINKNLDSGK